MSGGFFFEYFLLATQKKVFRLSVREPTLDKTVALATQNPQRIKSSFSLASAESRQSSPPPH
jgi:hypothetical protein